MLFLGRKDTCHDAIHRTSPHLRRCAAAWQARVWLQDGQNLDLFTLCESRIRRIPEKDTKQLGELQSTRQAARREALEQAKLLARFPDPDGNTGSFPLNGFEFSNQEINLLVRQDEGLKQAAFCSKPGWQRRHRPQKPA